MSASLLSKRIAGILQPKYMIMISLVGVGIMLIVMVNTANFWIALEIPEALPALQEVLD
ncbi:hypothetical protein KDI_43700 [Dictyobacter arantiisoli]|uniref:Uncharacterized protein n=2 Tax=Dictyobacter arantiisoli TaxID=2014874 RepID=A0A5A5TI59_9CHLR|nr:hypothetical protein KDI_43700 [Dictyobacter arantiisoli]